MASTLLGIDRFPTYLALSSDISSNKITGCTIVGGTIYLTNTGAWKIILPDLTLADYVQPKLQTA